MSTDTVDRIEADLIACADSLDAINDHFYQQGWTDGLPIVPPTPTRVIGLLAGMAWRDPDTLISRSFCPLGQVVAQSLAYPGLPIVLLPHPIGDADEDKFSQKGLDAVEECVRLLTTLGETIDAEFQAKKFPLPEHAVARL